MANIRGALAELDDRVPHGATPAADVDFVYPTVAYAERSVAHTVDYGQTVARQVLRTSQSTLTSPVREIVQDIVGTLVMQSAGAESRRIESCYRYHGTDQLRVRVYGETRQTAVELVRGTAGLQCATTGRVEGITCRLSDHLQTLTSRALSTTLTDPRVGYDQYVELNTELTTFPTPVRFFVVRLRSDATTPVAGAYEALGEAQVLTYSGFGAGYQFCHAEPVEPELAIAGGDAMAHSTTLCSVPANDCYGAPLTGPIPLEDELIDDGDGFESSWRYHLNVARRAADRADQLGEDLIENGLRMDLRAEEQNRILEETCGSGVSLDGLIGPTGAGITSPTTRVVSGPCSAGCAAGYDCVGGTGAGVCVLNAVAAAGLGPSDARALAECLGQDVPGSGTGTIVPVVALGSQPLCYWRETGSRNVLCTPGAITSHPALPCPYPVPDSGDCDQLNGEATPIFPEDHVGFELVEMSPEDTLNIMLSGSDEVGGGGAAASEALRDCSLIRTLRRDPGNPASLEALKQSNFFLIPNVRAWAERIGWRGYPDNFSMLTIDGTPWYGTGIPFRALSGQFEPGPFAIDPDGPGPGGDPPRALWPCAAGAFRDTMVVPAPTGCVSEDDGLFCSIVTCADHEERARFNDRLGRAALALAITSGVGPGHFWLPVSYQEGQAQELEGERFPERDFEGRDWRLFTSAQWGGDEHDRYTGLYAIPLDDPERIVWHRPDGTEFVGFGSSRARPMAFASLGSMRGRGAEWYGEALWGGLAEGNSIGGSIAYSSSTDPWFRSTETGERVSCLATTEADATPIHVFLRALEHGGDRLEIRANDSGCRGALAALSVHWKEPGSYVRYGNSLSTSQNLPVIAGDGFRTRDLLDAMELMCEGARYATEVDNCDPSAPPEVHTAADIPQLRAYFSCIANRLERQGENVILQNVPRRVVQQLRGERVAIRPDDGEYGRSIVNLRQALERVRVVPRSIATQIREFGSDLQKLELALAGIEARENLVDLRAAATSVREVASCVGQSSSLSLGSAATCANSAAQIVLAISIADFERSALSVEARGAIVGFRDSFQRRQELLASLSDSVMQASEDAHRELSSLASARRRASRALAAALFLDSDESGRVFHVNTAMRRIYNTRLIRYREAHRSAVQMAILARRALEQRLGVNLLDFEQRMSLVDPPSEWAERACESAGIDYARIRDRTELRDPDRPAQLHDNFADAYIGDYVNNLERFFDSYRIDYPATSGGSTSVVSMRDDVLNVRVSCEVPAYNLLAMSDDLSAAVVVPDGDDERNPDEPVELAWVARNCTTLTTEDGPSTIGCVDAYPTSPGPSESPLSDPGRRVLLGIQPGHSPTAYRVTFAAGATGASGDPPVSYTPDAELSQEVLLPAGIYRLSWFGRTATSGFAPASAVDMSGSNVVPFGGEFTVPQPSSEIAAGRRLGVGWEHYTRFYRVTDQVTVRVRIRSGRTGAPDAHSVDLAGLMLEDVSSRVDRASPSPSDFTANPSIYHPRPFVVTRAAARARLPECEDTYGHEFRRRWAYRCEQLCDAGFATCPTESVGDDDLYRCFWEAEFVLDQDQIDSGALLGSAGFAVGNFNYRIDNVALNFVGSASRTCEDVARPSACYSSGYIPYSIRHLPPYTVVDYDGRDYEAPLFEGRIEGALGLATERYLGNPLSSTDRSLIDGYRRMEMRGRPLAGRFLVRVWDVPGVNFSGIEDVQILLDYRYFTRTPAPAAR